MQCFQNLCRNIQVLLTLYMLISSIKNEGRVCLDNAGKKLAAHSSSNMVVWLIGHGELKTHTQRKFI